MTRAGISCRRRSRRAIPSANHALAAREAFAEPACARADEDPSRTGVVLGNASGGEGTREGLVERIIRSGQMKREPLLVPRITNQAAPAMVSIALGLTGMAMTVANGCAAANHAIAMAVLLIRQGVVDRVLTGGTEGNVCFMTVRAFGALRVLATDACRPFSRGRRGMCLGEGAGIVVIERADIARRRGAPIYGEIAGVGMSADASDLVHPAVEGAARAIRGALADARMAAEEVGYVNAHGTGTPVNDRVECAALKLALGDHARRIAVSSTKSLHGHPLGAAGGLEMVATLLALRHAAVPPTANYLEADPDCDLDVVPNEARPLRFDAALSNSFAFGGLNAVIAVRRYEAA